MKNPVFEKYLEHVGHRIEVVTYGDKKPVNVAIECTDCHEVLTDEDREVED